VNNLSCRTVLEPEQIVGNDAITVQVFKLLETVKPSSLEKLMG
jgi:hypothetical protein